MSYNCTSVETLKVDGARIKASDALKLRSRLQLPERCFLEAAAEQAGAAGGIGDIEIRSLEWSGEFSGSSFDSLKTVVAPKIMGRIEAVFCWEGGDSYSGLIIQDGVVTECDVKQTLVPRKKG